MPNHTLGDKFAPELTEEAREEAQRFSQLSPEEQKREKAKRVLEEAGEAGIGSAEELLRRLNLFEDVSGVDNERLEGTFTRARREKISQRAPSVVAQQQSPELNLGLGEFVGLSQNVFDISNQFQSELQRFGIERGRKSADFRQELFERGLFGKLQDVKVQQELANLGLQSVPTVGEQLLGSGIQALGSGVSAFLEQRALNQEQGKTLDFLNRSRVPGVDPIDPLNLGID